MLNAPHDDQSFGRPGRHDTGFIYYSIPIK